MNATCSRCGESHAVATYPSINVAADPDLKARVRDGSLFVWTIDKNSTAHRTPVEIGSTLGNRVAIISGLAAGQLIVVEGYQKLSEGTKVVY